MVNLTSILLNPKTKQKQTHSKRNTRKSWEVMDIFVTWDVGMISPVYAASQTHWIVYIKYVSFLWINYTSMCSFAQSCPTLCSPVDCSPPGSSVHGIFQARILEWVAISFSRGSSHPRDQNHLSCISCIGWWVPWQLSRQGIPNTSIKLLKIIFL